MYRVLALLVCAAFLSVSGPLSGLHVHEYATHDHEEHHHAPAAHSHAEVGHPHEAAPSAPAAAATPHLESCQPGAHTVAFAFTCVTPNAPHVALTVDLAFASAVRPPPSRPALLDLSDVRAHSPPRLTDAPLRAPPLVIPA